VTSDTLVTRLGLVDEPTTGHAVLLLPSTSSGPVYSGGQTDGDVELKAWRVPVVAVQNGDDLRDIAPEQAGPSVRYVLDVFRFAEDLLTRGQVLPSITQEPDGPAARWLPVLSGIDLARFTSLSDAMPAACRAEEPERDAAATLRTTLATLVDTEVRRRIASRPVLAGTGSTADDWWHALTGPPGFEGKANDVSALAATLTHWHARVTRQNPMRTCFRLRAPDQTDGDDWQLDILVQAVADPSVLVPAANVWQDNDSGLYRWVDDPERQLLADLGRASTLYPGLDAALQERRPTGFALEVAGAYDFLTHAELLAQAGFGVLVPSWWRRPGELCLKVTTTSTDAGIAMIRDTAVTLDEIVHCRWNLALGNETISEADLAELALQKIPLVRIRGRWTYVDRKRLAAGLKFLRRMSSGTLPAREVLRNAGLRPPDDLPLPVYSEGGTGWLADFLSGDSEGHVAEVAVPDDLRATLRPYQRRGLSWLAFLDRIGLGACLADDMGLGKTVQLLALEVLRRSERARPPTLVICPLSVVGNWQREAARFAPTLSVHVHHGPDRAAGDLFAKTALAHDIVVTTFSVAVKDTEELTVLEWERVVVDEAQNIKNSGTRQSRAIRAIPARHRVALTGTPVENRMSELWSIMDFTNPGMFGSANSFHARFAVPIERYRDQDAAARLRGAVRPFLLRRVKADPTIAPDLPEKIESIQLCNLTVEQATLYRAVVEDMLERIKESRNIQRKGLVLAAMTKLKQVCNHPAHLLGDGSPLGGRSGKLARVEQILDQVLAEGEKALCFTQFAAFGTMLQRHLTERFGTEVPFLHGGTSKQTRDAMVDRSQADDGPAIMLVSLKAGGTGLNLTAANHVIHVDRWWNPAVEDQATDRAFRVGQQRTVQVHKLLCIGTLEEKIDQLLGSKAALAQMVVGAGDDWLTELSFQELRELITLSPEAIVE
jgi:SNF2-related domain/SNF2 Helicase protein/Helicase conserved C-terminal domain